MERFLSSLKVFGGVFFGITGLLVGIIGILYLLIKWFGETGGVWAAIILIIFGIACAMGYMEYKLG